MTDIMKLADDYANACADVREFLGANAGWDESDGTWIASKQARAALQAECAEHKENAIRNARIAVSIRAERDALQAKLDELQRQEPVGFISAECMSKLQDPEWQELRGEPLNLWTVNNPPSRAKTPLYAAPKAPTHEQVEEAWRAGWAACRDAEYVGQEAEDNAWGMSETCANADWENAAPKALAPLTDEQRLAIFEEVKWEGEDGWEYYYGDVINAVERAHGIGGTP